MITAIIALLLVNQALAISQRTKCHSNNDPHMQGFNLNNFEFHNVGNFCMYNSGQALEIQAGFTPCYTGSASPTCNCMIQISILNTQNYASINICDNYDGFNNNYAIQTDLGTLQCATNNNIANLFNDNDWVPLTSNHPSFKCAITNMGFIALRTTLSSSNDDVLIKIYNYLSSFEIYPSNNYISNSMQNYDSCLCGTTEKLPNKENVLACEKELIANAGLTNFVRNLKAKGQDKPFVELVKNCALDIELLQENPEVKLIVGRFQKNVIFSKVLEAIFGNAVKAIKKNDPAWKAIATICASIKKIPNERCLINGKCDEVFELCSLRQ